MQKHLFILALAISASAFFLNQRLSDLPAVKPATVAESEFSAERAMTLLRYLLRDGVPHPVGSDANKRVKQRIRAWLADQEIQTEVQRSWGCSQKQNSCAWVENIIAVIPGEQESPYVALMAHYDSVPPAPGAGDDGAGLATVLEVAGMLKREGPFLNPILLIITDGEEPGLLGAEAFFAYHALKDKVGVIINLEGSGTTGQSRVLRTAMSNKSLIDAYGEGADYPNGASLINELFKRMPNDTDFSVSTDAEIPGIDFAFAGERNHYHTANDNLENLDLRTLQHHGENVLPLARTLAAIDLATLEPSSLVYSNVYGQWVSWPGALSLFLVIAAAVLLLIASIRLHPRPSRLIIAVASPLGIIAVCGFALFLNFKLIEILNGTMVAWPANDFPFRVVLFSAPAVAGFSLAFWVNRFLREEEGLLGLWWFWLMLALACVLLLPDAANLLILPLLTASILLVAASMLSTSARGALQLLTLVMVLPASLNMAISLEVTQGYRLIATTFFSLGIFFASISPFVRGVSVKPILVISTVCAIAGSLGAISMPLYSSFRPQHINLQFVQDLDKNIAYWQVQSQNPVPERFAEEMEFVQEAFLFPWHESKTEDLAETEPAELAAARLLVYNIRSTDEGQSFDLTVSSMRHASRIFFVFPKASGLRSFRLNGNTFEAKVAPRGLAKGNYVITFSGVQNRQVDFTLNFAGTQSIAGYLAEVSYSLPPSAKNLLQVRALNAAPVHQGDQLISFQKIEL